MRVLHIQKAAGISGSERHLLALLPALAAGGVEVRLCVLTAGDGARFVSAGHDAGVETAAIPAGPDANPLVVARLVAEIRRYRPDLVHTHLVHADAHGQLAARLTGTPAVASVHGIPSFYRRQPYRAVRQLAGRNARRTIAISGYVARHLVENRLAPAARVRVVHYGMDATGWALAPSDRDDARRALGLGPTDVAVGIASRLIPHKGHATLIAAVSQAVAADPRVRLLVAGAGPLRAELEQAAGALPAGTARFLGQVADIRPFMGACDVVAFPTDPEIGEGFGLAALEAMAAGRPVVATDVGPLPEIVVPDRTGILVPPHRSDALARALLDLAADPTLRDRLGQAAAERARDTFSLDRMVQGTIAVYEEGLGEGGADRGPRVRSRRWP